MRDPLYFLFQEQPSRNKYTCRYTEMCSSVKLALTVPKQGITSCLQERGYGAEREFQTGFAPYLEYSRYPNRKGCDKTSQKALFPFVNYLITSKLVVVVYLGWMLGQTAITVLILIIKKLNLTAPWETDSHTTDTTSIEEDLLTRTATYSHKLVASALCLTTANRTCSFMPWLELNYYWLSCLATNSKLGFGYFTTTTLLNQLIKGRIQQGCGQGEGYQLYSPTSIIVAIQFLSGNNRRSWERRHW